MRTRTENTWRRRESKAHARRSGRDIGALKLRNVSPRDASSAHCAAPPRNSRSKRSKLVIDNGGLRVAEVMRILGVSRSTVYRFCEGPQLSACMFPGGLRISPADVEVLRRARL